MRALSLFLLLFAVAAGPLAQTGDGSSDLLRAMEDAVARLDYETAEARAREALARFDALTPDQLVTVHTTLGVLLHARNEPIAARRQFELALSLRPALTLDPVLVSPKTLQFFEEVRAEMGAPEAGPRTVDVRYVVVPDDRPAAALRSLIAPGWGQFYKGEEGKGWAFALTGGALATGTVAAEVARGRARADYTEATTPAEAERLYGPYNRWHRASTALARATALVWAVAVLDALATRAPEAGPGPAPEAVSFGPAPEVGGVRLRVRL